MKIIKGQTKYIEACLKLARLLPKYFTNKAIDEMRNDLCEHILFIATDSEVILGFAAIHNKTPAVAELTWLMVHPQQQRQGVGMALVKHIVAELKSQEVRILEVKTLAKESGYQPYARTRRFFEKLGFTHLETIDPYPRWDAGNPCAIYVLVL